MVTAPSGFSTGKTIGVIVLLLAVAGMVAYTQMAPKEAAKTAEGPREVRWLLTHKPTDIFDRAAKVFADELQKETGGTLTLKVVTPDEIGISAPGDVPNEKVFELLNSGAVELASTYTVALGGTNPAFLGFNLPFLFKNYETAPALLDGTAGLGVLSGLKEAKALAFTMSGGFRVIASKAKVTSSAGLKGLHVATSGGAVAAETLTALGAMPMPVDLEAGTGVVDAKSVDAVETTYSRLTLVLGADTPYKKFVFESNHSMFLTAIVAGNAFFNSLTPAEQAALQKAALAAAAVEREDSIALGEKTKADLKASGTIISTPSTQDQDAMRKATQSVYKKFETLIGADLIKSLTN